MESYEHIAGPNPWKNDVAVLCIFWVRDDCFAQSFASVRQARPRRLLLWQDGPRDGNADDREHYLKCQEIAAQIDWDCEVYRNYHESNIGIWPGAFWSHKWAFTKVDKCIILEDDVVPSQSFYRFCEELLNRYEYDERVGRITGKNQVAGYQCPYDYFFSDGGSVWGWATWKRVADTWEEHYEFLSNPYAMKAYQYKYHSKPERDYLGVCEKHSRENRAHWETVSAFAKRLNHQLDIVPTVNLIENVGAGGKNSVHFSGIELEDMPKAQRVAFFSKAEEITFPLKHPDYVFPDLSYVDTLRKLTGSDSNLGKLRLELERYYLYVKHGHGKKLIQGLNRRLKKRIQAKKNDAKA